MEYAGEIPGSTLNYPIVVHVPAATENRDRLTTAFRFFLALPHTILVGGPVAVIASIGWNTDSGWHLQSGSAGLLGVGICFVVLLAWFAILLTGRYPSGLWQLSAGYLRWRVRVMAYLMLLRDEYPPFGSGEYAADIEVTPPEGPRDRLTVFFRFFLALPHLFLLWLLSLVWAFTTAIAWVVILLTGRYPASLYGFAIGVLAWDARVEAYMLLLRDEYPPFTLRA